MAAHLLELPLDIMSSVLSHLGTDHDDGDRVDRPSLARVAQTCRQLSSPAVAILWRELPAFTPMLCTLPADLYEIRAPVPKYQVDEYAPVTERFEIDKRPCPHLLGDPVSADFERWAVYAHFVHSIDRGQGSRRSPPFPHDFWVSLTRHGPYPLLPNLNRLRLSGPETLFLARNPFPFPFAGSCLRHLHLSYQPPRTDLVRILDKLAQTSSLRLEVLDIVISLEGEFTEERQAAGIEVIDVPLVASLMQSPSLHALRVQGIPISSAAIALIGTLQSLEDLSIMASGRLTPLNGDIGTFQLHKLKALEVRVDWLSWVTTFLQHVSAPRLEGLTVHCYDASSGDIAALYSLIAEHHPRLRKVNLEAFRESPCYTVDTLRPLLRLPQLTVLSMKGWGSFDVDDAFIAEVANAWLALELLELDPLRKARRFRVLRRTPPPRATLTGLVPLAQHCPKLESIRLALNTDVDLPNPAPWRSRPVRESQVQTLHVGITGPTRNPAQVVRFLSEHFPLLGSVGFYPRVAGYRRTVDEWNEVDDLLYHLSLIRRQERTWAVEGPGRRGTRCEADPGS